MSFKNISSILFLALIFIAGANAQTNWCGTVHDEVSDLRLQRNIKAFNKNGLQRSGVPKYIPITFIMVADDNGNGRILPERVLDLMPNLNSFYADQDISFYIDEFRYLDKTSAFNTPGSLAGEIQMLSRRDPNAINIFITNTANTGDELPGVTTLAYYSPNRDWIVSRKQDINGVSETIAHEIGHFFSLAHPHAGWDCLPYTEEEYGNPVAPVSTLCPGGSVFQTRLIEFADGSNCQNAGDRLCDTPADYNFQILHNSGGPCGNPTDIQDRNGDIVMPMFNNVMGYYLQCPDKEFTQGQKNIINSDYLSTQRNYIRTGNVPVTDEVNSADLNHIYPINGGESNEIVGVTLDWEDVPTANKYLVIVDRTFSTFTFDPTRYIVEESQLELPDFVRRC